MRRGILASLFLIAAVTAAFWLIRREFEKSVEPVRARSYSSAPSPSLGLRLGKKPVHRRAAPATIVQTNSFHWRDVESDDYRKYIANLRSVGCPEATVRDIVLTDLMKFYASKRGSAMTNGHAFKFWETDDQRKQTARQEEARGQRITEIDKEVAGVVRELLGVNYDRELDKYFVDTHRDEERLSFLSEEKRSHVGALRDRYEGLEEKVFSTMTENGKLSLVGRESLKQLAQAREVELSEMLSGTEWRQYQLVESASAERLRETLIGFNPSPGEFEAVFDIVRTHDDRFGFADPDDAAVRESADADWAASQRAIEEKLGTDRFRDFQLSQNKHYRNFYQFARLHELAPSVAQNLFQIKQTVEEEKTRLLDQVPNGEDRKRTLHAMRLETERAIREAVGDRPFRSFMAKGDSQWIEDLESFGASR